MKSSDIRNLTRDGADSVFSYIEWTAEEEEAFKAPVRKTYEDFSVAYNFASKTWCDMVIDPVETRDTLAMLMDMAGRMPAKKTDFGIFRM